MAIIPAVFDCQLLMTGQKRRFFIAGLLNVILSNFILQVLLYLQLLNAAASTFVYQAIVGFAGYIIYGKFVFNSSGLASIRLSAKFLILNLLLWAMNWLGLEIAGIFSINQNFVALLLIVPLSCCSYVLQNGMFLNKQDCSNVLVN